MKKIKDTLLGILGGALVGILALLVASSVSAKSNEQKTISIRPLPSEPLTQNSLVDDVLALMLESDQKWDTMVADYVLTTRDAENGDQLYQEDQKFWLSKKGEWARVEISTDGMPLIVFVRNASTLNRENKKYKVYSTENTPDVFLYNDFNPRQLLLDTGPAVVYLHPYGKALPTGYYDFLYPTAIAQSMISNKAEGTEDIQIIGEDEIAGRKVVVISRMPKNHLYWVDAITGVILRVQYIGNFDSWQVQFEAQNIAFDERIPGSVFQFLPDKESKRVNPEEYRNLPNEGR